MNPPLRILASVVTPLIVLVSAASSTQAAPPAQKFSRIQPWMAAQKSAPELIAAQPVWQKGPMSVMQKSPTMAWQKGPIQSVQKAPVEVWQKSAPASCCPPARRIIYRDCRICKRKCCSCAPPVQMVLLVTDPCQPCACPVEVPVCVPGCCPGLPVMAARHDLLGRGTVTCTWASGFTARIIFRHTGDLLVQYCGH
ncbi:MAG: hypothetical protein JJ992_11465 [Planctomycetes bacterium]|nr:hypothetical protein [Planctomycetota bacterium]